MEFLEFLNLHAMYKEYDSLQSIFWNSASKMEGRKISKLTLATLAKKSHIPCENVPLKDLIEYCKRECFI